MGKLTFPDQQQDLQNAADYTIASECDGSVKFPRLAVEADSAAIWLAGDSSGRLGAFHRHGKPFGPARRASGWSATNGRLGGGSDMTHFRRATHSKLRQSSRFLGDRQSAANRLQNLRSRTEMTIPYVRIQSNVRFAKRQIMDWIADHAHRAVNGVGAIKHMERKSPDFVSGLFVRIPTGQTRPPRISSRIGCEMRV